MNVLILGGFGNFGARIVRALAQGHGISVFAAGRNPSNAPPDVANSNVRCVAIDLTSPRWADALRLIKPVVVIHCVGPFQGQDTSIAKAVLAAGAHYIDIADGRAFVAQFAAEVHATATRAKRLAVTGASTLPALSSTVVDALLPRFSRLDGIDTVIAPGQRAPRGAATLAAVLSYAGVAFPVWRGGTWRTAIGWLGLSRVALGPLGARWAADCDVPDLALFPARYATVKDVRFRAALEVGVQHFAIATLAWLRRLGIPLPITKLSSFLEWAAKRMDRFGSGDGTMTVTLRGLDHAQQPLTLRWQVIAPNHHGPEIPCMAAILITKRLARGDIHQVGAMPCMGLLTLDAFTPEFAKWGMTTDVSEPGSRE